MFICCGIVFFVCIPHNRLYTVIHCSHRSIHTSKSDLFSYLKISDWNLMEDDIPCLNCYTWEPTGSPTYFAYSLPLGFSITGEGIRVFIVMFVLITVSILVTYIGYVRSSYNRYGEPAKDPDYINSSTHSEAELIRRK